MSQTTAFVRATSPASSCVCTRFRCFLYLVKDVWKAVLDRIAPYREVKNRLILLQLGLMSLRSQITSRWHLWDVQLLPWQVSFVRVVSLSWIFWFIFFKAQPVLRQQNRKNEQQMKCNCNRSKEGYYLNDSLFSTSALLGRRRKRIVPMTVWTWWGKLQQGSYSAGSRYWEGFFRFHWRSRLSFSYISLMELCWHVCMRDTRSIYHIILSRLSDNQCAIKFAVFGYINFIGLVCGGLERRNRIVSENSIKSGWLAWFLHGEDLSLFCDPYHSLL